MKNDIDVMPFNAEQTKLLCTLSEAKLSGLSALAKSVGMPVEEALLALCSLGYVRTRGGRRHDGLAIQFFSLTEKGEAAALAIKREETVDQVKTPTRSTCADLYDGSEMKAFIGRDRALDAFSYPSRIGERLYHPDGSVTRIK